jgi:hypothetical protein
MHMTRQRTRRDQGFALVYMAVFLTFLLIATGLAVDGGRAYVVKAQLTKAVDGAALSAARNLNSGSPRAQAEKIFRANFPDGYMGVSSVTNPDDRRQLLRHADRRRHRREYRHRTRQRGGANDIHAPREFPTGHRVELW